MNMPPGTVQNWRKRLTKLEKTLTCISIIELIGVIALVIVFVWVATSRRTEITRVPFTVRTDSGFGIRGSDSENCLTTECITTASSILSKLKLGVEPCDDFYEFSCGTFMETEMIPEDKVSINTFSAISEKLEEQLRDIVTKESPETDPKYFRLPNKLYKACMNKMLIESFGTLPIRKIAKTLGDWPVIKGSDWDSVNKWTWQETTKRFRRLGFSMDYVVDFSIGVDLKNTTKRVIDLDQSSIGLSREYLIKGFNETLVSAYYDYMVDMAVLFGADRERALKEMGESLQFEMDLAKITLPDEKRRDANDLYNLFTIAQLQERYPYAQWLDYINALLPKGLKVEEDEPINVQVPSFFDALGMLLARTPKRVIANYMMWRIHDFAVPFLPELFRARQLEYVRIVRGIQDQEEHWKECIGIVNDRLPIVVGSLYARKHSDDGSKTIASHMVNNIRAVFSTILDEVSWMDVETKQEAQKKLHSMATHIGFPDELLDNNKLAEYYDQLDINEEHYLQSFLKITIFETDYAFNQLRLPVNKADWKRHANPTLVDAFYTSVDNSIHLPAGVLQGHFFNLHRPQYVNFGVIGNIIAHEITHGFDDQARQFDEEGNLKNWWTPDDEEAFLEKARCIIEQYGNYTDRETGLKLNGINTQGENIADNGGVKQAYLAYKRWAAQHGPEEKLPGLDYTPEQLFWVSTAQTLCAKYRRETLKNIIITGEHTTPEFRVIGSLSNMKDFSRDFQCPKGSPMNPMHKCVVW